MAGERAEHLETLRVQTRFAVKTLRTTADVLERSLASDLTPETADRCRSQARSGMRALRLTNQLLARAAELIDRSAQGGTANDRTDDRPVRVG